MITIRGYCNFLKLFKKKRAHVHAHVCGREKEISASVERSVNKEWLNLVNSYNTMM